MASPFLKHILPQEQPIFQLIYTSLAVGPMQSADLALLLQQSRTRNALHGITGLLVYDYGAFLQVLEGHKVEVETIFASIERDRRHTNIRVLTREPKPDREFHTWSMAWADISQVGNRGHDFAYDLPRLKVDQARSYLHHFLRSAAL